MLGGVWLFGTPSTVMYSSAVVRARAPHFYPEDRFYHDTDAAFQILVDHDFGFVHQILTFTRYQPASITYNERHFLSRNIDRVLSLHQYGKFYLTPDEFNRAMSNAWRAYYRELGRQWLLDRVGKSKPEFWEYHKKRLAGIDMKIDTERTRDRCRASSSPRRHDAGRADPAPHSRAPPPSRATLGRKQQNALRACLTTEQ